MMVYAYVLDGLTILLCIRLMVLYVRRTTDPAIPYVSPLTQSSRI